MKTRKMISLLLVIMMLISCVAAYADDQATDLGEPAEAFEAIDEAVVAEGVGYSNWGYDMNLLWQEYENGQVRIYMTCVMEGQPSVFVTFDAELVKGVDEDGDAELVLTLNGATMDSAMGLYDGAAWIEDLEEYSYTYDEDSGEYSFPFIFSLSGYTPVTVDIDVAPVEEAADPVEWAADFISADELIPTVAVVEEEKATA